MSRTALALTHVAFEDAGLLAPVLAERGIALIYADVPVTALDTLDVISPDLLIVLGGPIGVYEEEDYPWLKTETALIAQRLAAQKPTLGICLGAQLMAKALGAKVGPGKAKEIGWAPLALTEAGKASPLKHVDGAKTPVLHWHGDTFDLPDGAARLASTEICETQAFAIGTHALGLQFHLEAYGQALERWFVGHTAEIGATPGVSVAGLRTDTREFSDGLERQGRLALNEWLERAGL
ncbi:glutamine amidotransferase [Tepidicaulis sp. LMO-SS28]|uniref:glutamine amidotransferase n=1 Tax=Tepidicaulis sp. LMO-SS28 TaxID=3447455 RepID=UPI003EDFA5B0